MFAAITFRIALTCFIFSNAAAFAAPGLSVHVSGPQTIEGIENLKLVATVTNTGDETLKLLKDPRSLLSNSLPADKFFIMNRAGDMPSFNGVIMKYTPSEAALAQSEEAFTVLPPGDFVDIEHDLWEAYDFTLSGTGYYSFEPHNVFYYVNSSTSTAVPIYAHTIIHEVYISGRLTATRQNPAPNTRDNQQFVACTPERQLILQHAFAPADNMVKAAATYLRIFENVDLYTIWFGHYAWWCYSIVVDHFLAMQNVSVASYTYSCQCIYPGAQAYVNINDDGTIHICSSFWDIPMQKAQSGILVHEASHFKSNGGCKDIAYGVADSQSLAKKAPTQAIHNADNHRFFAESF